MSLGINNTKTREHELAALRVLANNDKFYKSKEQDKGPWKKRASENLEEHIINYNEIKVALSSNKCLSEGFLSKEAIKIDPSLCDGYSTFLF